MQTGDTTLTAFARQWEQYQDKLIAALAPLTAEQLDQRPAPGLRSVGEIATHIIGARARWMHEFWPDGGGEQLTVFTGWDRPGTSVRTASDLVDGLTRTWQPLRASLEQLTDAQLSEEFANTEDDDPPNYTRRWIIWHLIEHDLHHGGELSYVLGMHGLAAPDL
ncbi:MAG: DinB family protein [Ktedonobacterales bacterium]